MVCNNCGNALKDTAKFCSGCGNSTTAGYVDLSIASVPEPQPQGVAEVVTTRPATQELLVGCVSHPAINATEKCLGCGNSFCQDCLVLNNGNKYCLNCSASARAFESQALQPYIDPLAYSSSNIAAAPTNSAQVTFDSRFAGLSPYYQQEFSQITASGELYKGKWNWAAFFFGGLWALTKGAWATFLVSVAINLVIVGITCGWGFPVAFVFPIIYGLRGNYIYFNAIAKNKQIVF